MVLALTIVGAVASSGRSKSQAAGTSVTAVNARSLQTTALPSGYGSPISLAVAADGSVWYWADGATEATLFHWSPDATSTEPTMVNLGSPSSLGLVTGLQSAVAVDSSGTVWIGANQSLVSYDPTTGTINRMSLPASSTDQALASHRPPELASAQTIVAMAAGPNDQLAIATENSNAVQVLDTATGSFHPVTLPDGTDATDVSYDSDGSLAIAETLYSSVGGTDSGDVSIVEPDGRQTSATGIWTQHLTSTGSGFLANDGQQTVSEAGSIEASPAPAAVGTSGGTPTSARAGGWSVVAGGVTAYTSAAGIVVNKADGSQSVVELPTYACGGEMVPPGGATADAPSQCPGQAEVLAGSDTGLFAVLTGAPSVGFLPAGAY